MPRLLLPPRARRLAILASVACLVFVLTTSFLHERSALTLNGNVETDLKTMFRQRGIYLNPNMKPETLLDLVNWALNETGKIPLPDLHISSNQPNKTEMERLKIENGILKADIQSREALISFLSQPIINEEYFEYIHNPRNACEGHETEVLFAVPSKPENFENRNKVRLSERGKYAGAPENRAKLLFFVGRHVESGGFIDAIQDRIEDEVLTYQDVVQVDLRDTYKNIRLKTVSMLHWASTFCARAEFFIRTDDDVKVNVTKAVSALRAKRRQHRHFVLGEVQEGWEPIRKADSKYFLSKEEYPGSTLPPFAIGGLLGFPMETASLLYQCALRLEPLWLDDVYITGLCAPKMGVPLLSDADFRFKHWDW